MTFEIRSDTEYESFEIVCRNRRFGNYPGGAIPTPWGNGYYIPITGNWYKQLEDIASWVNNELNEECLFEIG